MCVFLHSGNFLLRYLRDFERRELHLTHHRQILKSILQVCVYSGMRSVLEKLGERDKALRLRRHQRWMVYQDPPTPV